MNILTEIKKKELSHDVPHIQTYSDVHTLIEPKAPMHDM